MLRQIQSLSNTGTAKRAYFSLFETQLRKCLAVWVGTTQSNFPRVLILQKESMRTLVDLLRIERCRNAFKRIWSNENSYSIHPGSRDARGIC